MPDDNIDERVLIVAPVGQDAAAMAALLQQEGLSAEICANLVECCERIAEGAGAVLLTEEALVLPQLVDFLWAFEAQPAWSELPLLLLASAGGSRLVKLFDLAAAAAGSLTLLERPMSGATLLRSVQVALSSRRRQYLVRDLLEEQQRKRGELEDAKAKAETELAERKLAEEALRQSEASRSLALEGGQMGTWSWNPVTGQFELDEKALELFALRAETFDGAFASLTRLVHESDLAFLQAALTNAVEYGAPCEVEFRVKMPDGTIRWLRSVGRAVPDDPGKVVRVAGVNFDITERKNVEAALAKAQRELQEHAANLERTVAERTAKLHETIGELEHFSYTITHDMRAPLRAMQGFAGILQEECASLPPDLHHYLDLITQASKRMDALITDALQYSKIVGAQVPLASIEPGPLLRGIIESYPVLQSSSAEILVQEPLPPVLANQACLNQCFSNLLTNAVKFVAPGVKPRIRIWAENGAGKVRFWFEDNGIGIKAEYHQRIFGMFQRLSRDYEGTGIGLALVRKVTERMGGKVGVESELGKGSRFWVEFQRAPPP